LDPTPSLPCWSTAIPNFDDRYLTLRIRQANYPKDFMSRIDPLTAGVADELSQKSGWIVVTTDFRRPIATA
jgi:hypothetical protein